MESRPTREETEKAAAAWLLKRSDPQWSHADQTELDEWLAASPGHRVSFIRLESIWVDTDRLKSIASGFSKGQIPPRGAIEQSPFFTMKQAETKDRDPETEVFSSPDNAPLPLAGEAPRVTISKEDRPRRGSFAIAASILLATAVVVTIYSIDYAGRGKSYSTSVGGLSTVPTQDGSVVTLNTDSKIEVRFTAQERRIELKKGEAFFEVAKDPSKPFTVYAGNQRVVAVGTKFSVRLNPNAIHVAVTEGKVRLEERPSILDLPRRTQPPENHAGARDGLTAGTVADIAESRISVEQRPIPEIEQTLSWRTGYIVLNGTPLSEAIAEFNRYNTRQLTIGDTSLAMLKVEGNFRSNNLDGFVRLLEEGFEVKAGETGDGRIVLSKK